MKSIQLILCSYALITNLCLILCDIEVFRETLEGVVEASNYSHYSYSGEYQISIILRSVEGDADLYVSRADASGRAVKPSFESYDLQSVTCGDDRVDIVDSSFERPIGIAVYGHPSHDISVYTLDVIAFANNLSDTTGQYLNEDELNFYESFFGEPYAGINRVPNSKRIRSNERSNHQNNDKRTDFWEFVISVVGGILQILLEIIAN